ncbi:hypothetical protein SVIOM342S_10444 [Streptomyces violaceorubidus]
MGVRWTSSLRTRTRRCAWSISSSPRRRMPLRGVEAATTARSTRRSSACTRAASSRIENGLVM